MTTTGQSIDQIVKSLDSRVADLETTNNTRFNALNLVIAIDTLGEYIGKAKIAHRDQVHKMEDELDDMKESHEEYIETQNRENARLKSICIQYKQLEQQIDTLTSRINELESENKSLKEKQEEPRSNSISQKEGLPTDRITNVLNLQARSELFKTFGEYMISCSSEDEMAHSGVLCRVYRHLTNNGPVAEWALSNAIPCLNGDFQPRKLAIRFPKFFYLNDDDEASKFNAKYDNTVIGVRRLKIN